MSHNIYRNRRDLGSIISTDKLLATDYRRYIPKIDEPLLTLRTFASSGSNAFDPTFIVSSGTLHWDLGDGNTIDSNSFTYSYADSSEKVVKLYKGTTTGALSITGIDLNTDRISGVLDLSIFTNLSGNLLLYSNNYTGHFLTSVILPTTSEIFTSFYISLCGITPSLDCTPLTNLGGTFSCYNNTTLNHLYLPTINRQFDTVRADSCALDVTSVDSIFSKLNTWYLSHTPTANLSINTSGGTNGSLTGGSSNSDLVSLQSIFAGAGKLLNASYN